MGWCAVEPVAVSAAMREVLLLAERVAAFPTTVLIEGETGVGKEVVADHIHHHSPRRTLPFIKVNCASIPETLFESELFGYERGAFTGAKREGHPGLFELANGGTLLLDEVGELSPSLQAKLLRVLQDREIRRIGGSWSKSVDVRILASTNRDLWEMVRTGRFREDLYYRLSVVHLRVPPLRERREDILPLCHTFVEEFSESMGLNVRLAADAAPLLVSHPWPGNVRELRNATEALCVMAEAGVITARDVERVLHRHAMVGNKAEATHERAGRQDAGVAVTADPATLPTYAEAMAEAERSLLTRALAVHPSVRAAARALGLSHSTLLRKLERAGLKPDAGSTR